MNIYKTMIKTKKYKKQNKKTLRVKKTKKNKTIKNGRVKNNKRTKMALRTMRKKGGADNIEVAEDECPICKLPMNDDTNNIDVCGHGHFFHNECVISWCNTQRTRRLIPDCPICNRDISNTCNLLLPPPAVLVAALENGYLAEPYEGWTDDEVANEGFTLLARDIYIGQGHITVPYVNPNIFNPIRQIIIEHYANRPQEETAEIVDNMRDHGDPYTHNNDDSDVSDDE